MYPVQKTNNIPYGLIAELSRKIAVQEYIEIYERETEKIRKNNSCWGFPAGRL